MSFQDDAGWSPFASLHRTALVAGLCFAMAGGALAQSSPPPRPGQQGAEDADAWQRQQPTRERTRSLMQDEGVARAPAERREELRDLNAIARDLLPPGAALPAPDLERAPPAPTGRN